MLRYNRTHSDGHIPLDVALRILSEAKNIEEARENMVLATEPQPITLEQAAKIAGRSYRTIQIWVQTGLLLEVGREPFAARNGGKVLVDLRDVRYLAEHPPQPTGRPKRASQLP